MGIGFDEVEVVGDPDQSCCVLWGRMETHLGLAEEPAGCEAVETVTQRGSFKDSRLEEDQETQALAGDGQGVRGGSMARV